MNYYLPVMMIVGRSVTS